MPFSVSDFARIRPYVYHLTFGDNVARILRDSKLLSAAAIMRDGGRDDMLRVRRLGAMSVNLGGESILLRDQDPLKSGNLKLEQGWELGDLVAHINNRVFFWPGREDGPIQSGRNHFARYQDSNPIILRIRTDALLSANDARVPLFCKYNSGAPRCNRGQPSPRLSTVFVQSESAPFRAAQAIEMTYETVAHLPPMFEIGPTPFGPWQRAK